MTLYFEPVGSASFISKRDEEHFGHEDAAMMFPFVMSKGSNE
jgi:hypothetical protein